MFCFGAAFDDIVKRLLGVTVLFGEICDGLTSYCHDVAYDLFTIHDSNIAEYFPYDKENINIF